MSGTPLVKDCVNEVLLIYREIEKLGELKKLDTARLIEIFMNGATEDQRLVEGEMPCTSKRLEENKSETDAIFSNLKKWNQEQYRLIVKLHGAYYRAAIHEALNLREAEQRPVTMVEIPIPRRQDGVGRVGLSHKKKLVKKAARSKRYTGRNVLFLISFVLTPVFCSTILTGGNRHAA